MPDEKMFDLNNILRYNNYKEGFSVNINAYGGAFNIVIFNNNDNNKDNIGRITLTKQIMILYKNTLFKACKKSAGWHENIKIMGKDENGNLIVISMLGVKVNKQNLIELIFFNKNMNLNKEIKVIPMLSNYIQTSSELTDVQRNRIEIDTLISFLDNSDIYDAISREHDIVDELKKKRMESYRNRNNDNNDNSNNDNNNDNNEDDIPF
jgi:hypothetical protein